ncbi:uncharacterized protein LOC122058259 [Macadamia integrifolia]|uniref:uncharacterized protein LOC122058259 n=1 Tax=Macadamia integrifolia TaxID=60698 RepID=UPI001C532BF5|nr:uncharacterized protein LOC122058259 [Macadamia integrifolia]
MATGKSYLARPSYRFLGGNRENSNSISIISDSPFEFDEADVWTSNHGDAVASPPELKKMMIPSSRISKKLAKRVENGGDFRSAGVTSSSLPVNIPDWSKILKEDYRDSRQRGNDVDLDDDDDDDSRIPPHEFLAKQFARNTRVVSFSVHEGIGRTLKGRDLSKVRNAIWEKTGFED